MVKRKWLWGKKSCEKIAGETETSGSMSSHSDKISEDQEPLKGSPNNSQSPEVNSKATESIINDGEETNEREKSLTQKLLDASENDRPKDSLLEEDASVISMNGDTQSHSSDACVEDISKSGLSNGKMSTVSTEDPQGVKFALLSSNSRVEDNENFKLLTEKLSAALVNVSQKDELVKQHSKVAEEAVAGWEKAEKEVDSLKQQLEAVVQKKSSLEDRVTQLDEALKECVRQLRLARDEQERKINQAVAERTSELEISKTRLEDQVVELQTLLETSRMNSPDPELQHRTEFLEHENALLRQELQSLSEQLEVRTIERDLSTKAAETASKQHLESIKKLARLEADCRKLKSLSRVSLHSNEHKSSAAAVSCAESLTDSQSDGAELLSASECDSRKINGSWASALMAELDQFTTEKVDRNMNPPSTDINLMDDFLEMERLASLPNGGPQVQSVGCDKTPEKAAHKEDTDLESMTRQTAELEENICKVEAEKALLAITLAQTQSCFEESQVKLIETQMKLEQLDRELREATEGEQFYKALFIQFEREANLMSSQIKSLRAEIEKEQALSEQISAKCKDLENELIKKEEELEYQQEAMFSDEFKMKEMDLAQTQDSLEKSETQLKQAEIEMKELEKKLQEANEEKKLLNSELDSVRDELQRMSSQIVLLNEQAQKGLQTENKQMELEKELQEANEEKKSLNSELDCLKAELQTMSSQIELLNERAQKGRMTENMQVELEKELQEANEEKKSLNSELDCLRAELVTMSLQLELLNEQAQKGLMTENAQMELEKELQRANEENKSLNSELDHMRTELQTMSSQIESLNEQVQKGLLDEQVQNKLEKELQQAHEEKKSLNAELDGTREELQTMSSQIELSNEQVQNELEKELQQANGEKKSLNSELDDMREELRTMSSQIELLNEQLQKEQALVAELSTKYEEMGYELQKKTQELNAQQRAHSNNEVKIKQEDLAVAAGKLADCQQTIASLGSQLKSLATLEDFLIDTASIAGFPPPAPLMARHSTSVPWKLHSNDTYLTEKEYEPLRNTQGDFSPFASHNRRDTRGSPASSSSSTSSAFFLNYPGSEKNDNGFANFYSLSRS